MTAHRQKRMPRKGFIKRMEEMDRREFIITMAKVGLPLAAVASLGGGFVGAYKRMKARYEKCFELADLFRERPKEGLKKYAPELREKHVNTLLEISKKTELPVEKVVYYLTAFSPYNKLRKGGAFQNYRRALVFLELNARELHQEQAKAAGMYKKSLQEMIVDCQEAKTVLREALQNEPLLRETAKICLRKLDRYAIIEAVKGINSVERK